MSKRRVFDIEFPEAPDASAPAGAADDVPAGTPSMPGAGRRGPMASAIGENAEALRERQAAEAAIRAENDRLAHEHVRLKKAGLIVDLVPLEAIATTKLVRDRALTRDPEIDELKRSIQDIGLSNPIRVEQAGEGYELVQGFRRLTAFRELLEETGDAGRFGRIPAGLIARGEALEALYRRMVDENLVRRDISFAEMAELARSYAADPETAAGDLDAAVAALYGSAGRQKRSYIKHFAALLERVGGQLAHAPAVPRALGLDLLKRIEREPGTLAALRRALSERPDRSAEDELAVLRRFAAPAPASPRGQPGQGAKARPGARTTFRVARPEGEAKCTAADGRLELRLPRDFSAEDRRRLERAVAAFFDALDG